jgi:hypothetical protein
MEELLQKILNTLYTSELFLKESEDEKLKYCVQYERIAKQHDEELLERHNGGLDVLLIFVRVFPLSFHILYFLIDNPTGRFVLSRKLCFSCRHEI